MNRRVWIALIALAASVGCLQTEGPQPQAEPRRQEVEDEVPGPGGDDDLLPHARSERTPTTACTALTCADLDASCGSAPDGCGGVVQCGSCEEGQQCGLTEPRTCSASETPRTCVPRSCGTDCGLVFDGCAGVLECGACS